jgi:hypothetical protein
MFRRIAPQGYQYFQMRKHATVRRAKDASKDVFVTFEVTNHVPTLEHGHHAQDNPSTRRPRRRL